MWKPSPDTPAVRSELLRLVAAIPETPATEYPIGIHRDEVVIWQLGEFRERRAVPDLERIVAFDPSAKAPGPFERHRETTIDVAKEALSKITDETRPT